jgi:hypothetical protein
MCESGKIRVLRFPNGGIRVLRFLFVLPLPSPSPHPVSLFYNSKAYLIPAPLPSEPPLHYDSDPPPQASALHCDARNNTRTRRTWRVSRLRSASPLRSAPLPTIALVIVFFALRSKKGNEN